MLSQVQPYHDFDNSGKPQNGNNGKNYFPANGNGHPAPADTPIVDSPTFLDSSYLGFTRIPEYFSIFWTRLVGAKAALLYIVIFTHCYGNKTSCFPSLELLAAILNVDRHTLKGRERTNKATGKRYHKEGLIEILLRHGLVTMSRRGKSYEYELVKILPLLNEEQIKALPLILRKRHERDLGRIRANQEKQQEKDKKHQEKEQADMVRFSPDMVRQGHRHMVRQGHHESDKETDIKNLSEKAEREVVSNKEKTRAEETDFSSLVRSIYEKQGETLSNDRIGGEVKRIKGLLNEHTDSEIRIGLSWIANNLNRFPDGIHSVSGLLKKIIAQALEEAEKERQQQEQRAKNERRLREQEELADKEQQESRKELEERYGITEMSTNREIMQAGAKRMRQKMEEERAQAVA